MGENSSPVPIDIYTQNTSQDMRPACEPTGLVTADAATGGKYLPFPGTWWQLMTPLWQTNVLVSQIKETTFKEVRPVTGAISNTKPNYDPTSADHTRLMTRTTGTAEDIRTFWKWKLLKSYDELVFTTQVLK